MKKRIITFLLISFIFVIWKQNILAETVPQEQLIKLKYKEKWTKIPEASKYRLEIKDNNDNQIFEIETENNEVEVEIAPGNYKKRLGILNQFNRVILWTEWRKFTIIEIVEPKISHIQKKTFTRDEKESKNLITIEGLTPQTKIYLEDKNTRKVKEVPYKQIDTNRIELLLKPIELSSGNYNLIVENSKKKRTKIENAIFIDFSQREKKEIKLQSLGWKSLIPGLPQYELNEKRKSMIIASIFTISILYTGYSLSRANYYYNRYKTLTRNNNFIKAYYSTTTFIFPLQINNIFSINNSIKNFNHYRNQALAGMGLSLIIYAYHYYDFFNSFQKVKSEKNISFQLQFSL